MKLKILVPALACALALGICGQAKADFMLNSNYSGSPGGLEIKYQNYESKVTKVGDVLFGLANVTSIVDNNNNGLTVWAEGQGGQGQLTAVFDHFVLKSITSDGPGKGFDLRFTGGTFDIYYNGTVTRNIHVNEGTSGTDATVDNGGHFTDGTLELTSHAVPGIDKTDATVTLFSHVDSVNNLGTGHGFFKLFTDTSSGGLGAIFPPGSQFLGASDVFSNKNSHFPNQYPIGSHDPLKPFTASVPEPSTLVLAGFGLVSLLGGGYVRRRKMARVA